MSKRCSHRNRWVCGRLWRTDDLVFEWCIAGGVTCSSRSKRGWRWLRSRTLIRGQMWTSTLIGGLETEDVDGVFPVEVGVASRSIKDLMWTVRSSHLRTAARDSAGSMAHSYSPPGVSSEHDLDSKRWYGGRRRRWPAACFWQAKRRAGMQGRRHLDVDSSKLSLNVGLLLMKVDKVK